VFKISDATNLAFHAMLFLAAAPKGTQNSVQQLAKKMRASENHLSKVMQRLAKTGLVTSVRGPKGGFCLAKPSRKIRLLDVYKAIEGPLSTNTCFLGNPVCEGDCCLMGNLIGSMQNQIKDHLTKTTLSEIGGKLTFKQ